MGALEGSITFKSFYIDAELPKKFKETFLTAVRKSAFEPLQADSEDDKRLGWVNIQDPLDRTFASGNNIFFNEYLCLGLRMDRWAIPTPLLKAKLKEANKVFLESSGQERIGRRQRAAIKQQVIRGLREQMMPSMKVIDVVWNINQAQVKFWSHGKGMVEAFMGLFEHTFGMRLIPESPYTAAMALGLGDEALEHMATTEPSAFGSLRD